MKHTSSFQEHNHEQDPEYNHELDSAYNHEQDPEQDRNRHAMTHWTAGDEHEKKICQLLLHFDCICNTRSDLLRQFNGS